MSGFLCGLTLPNLEQDQPPNNMAAPQVKKPTSQDPLLARRCLVDMVDAEQVMVDDPFDQVEQTEADQERAGEQLGRPSDLQGRRRHRTISPITTKTYVVAWNRPSQKVLIFKFSTLVAG